MTSSGKEITGFELAVPDRICYPAAAKSYKNSLEVIRDKVPHPIAVRYVFKDSVWDNLYVWHGRVTGETVSKRSLVDSLRLYVLPDEIIYPCQTV